MKLKFKAFGNYQTNCYIVSIDGVDFIIDAGIGASEWVIENVSNPVAILNTHGHFDHIWSNRELKEKLKIPIYISKFDSFFLRDDPFGQNIPISEPDYEVQKNEVLDISNVKVIFHHFPGHTPGSNIIEIENTLFSGDFIFKGSIGRVDFPFSNPEQMRDSIERFLELKRDAKIYPGHGDNTTIAKEQKSVGAWLNYI